MRMRAACRLLLLPLLLLPLLSVCLLPLARSSSPPPAAPPSESSPHHYPLPEPLTRLAFGSCNHQHKQQSLWAPILASQPSAFVFLGDVVYADRSFPYLPFIRWPGEPDHVRRQYETQLANPHFQELRRAVPIIGVWDDHDLAENDGNRHSPNKDAAAQLFLDFMAAPSKDVRRARQGIYTSYTFGPAHKRVKLILLDIRYHQDVDALDMLGEEQWMWLAEELDYSAASSLCSHAEKEGTEECVDGLPVAPSFLLIGSSIQFGALSRPIGEGWRHFPASRQRLLQLLHAAKLDCPVLFLSGDVHYAEAYRSDHCTNTSDSVSVLPVLDVTSSGMTHSLGRQLQWISLAQRVMPWFLSKPPQPAPRSLDQLCLDHNFGLLDFDWQARTVRIQILGREATPCIDATLPFSSLTRYELPLSSVAWPDFPSRTGANPMHTSSPDPEASLARCVYERYEAAHKRWHISGLKSLVSLAAAIIMLVLICVYFVLRGVVRLVLWALRRAGLGVRVSARKKRQ